MSEEEYIHGYTEYEKNRLLAQGLTTAGFLFKHFDFSGVEYLLELGCGVGAQSVNLLSRYPKLKLCGIDLSGEQLDRADKNLQVAGIDPLRYDLVQGNLLDLDLPDNQLYDGGLFCWVLEHIPDPVKALSEAKRVLIKGSPLFINETFNSSFYVYPRNQAIEEYWKLQMEVARKANTRPDLGSYIVNYLLDLEFENIRTFSNTVYHDDRNPQAKEAFFLFWLDVMRSYLPPVLALDPGHEKLWKEAESAMLKLSKQPRSIFFYNLIQLSCTT